MNIDTSEPRKYCADLMRYKNPQLQLRAIQAWKKANPEKVKASNDRSNRRVKEEALAHYGKDGAAVCCWDGCHVADLDMLTIDHIHNDGALHRGRGRGGTGVDMYRKLRSANWPDRFQTLCWNHQWKKEILRRHDNREMD